MPRGFRTSESPAPEARVRFIVDRRRDPGAGASAQPVNHCRPIGWIAGAAAAVDFLSSMRPGVLPGGEDASRAAGFAVRGPVARFFRTDAGRIRHV